MWTDNETTEDFLGYQVQAELIREVILDPRLQPVTVGVFGEWGSGKSSLMQMLRQSFDPDLQTTNEAKKQCESVAVLHFNGWLFEGYDDAKAALLNSILEELRDHKLVKAELRDRFSGLIKRVKIMRLLRLGLTHIAAPAAWAYYIGGPPATGLAMAAAADSMIPMDAETGALDKKALQNTSAQIEGMISPANAETSPADVRSFRRDFENLLKDSNIKLLVVLIDDLDRCSPERIIDNLEAIKLFLNVENTAFVIGADPRIVRHAIAHRYREVAPSTATAGEEDANERLVVDYLEKLIQVPFSIPRLSRAEIETYITLLFCQKELNVELYKKCMASCVQEQTKDRYSAFGFNRVQAALKPEIMSETLQQALTLCAGVADMVTEGLNGNPRQVKRFLNAFFLRRKLSQVAKMDNIRDEVLFKLMLLEYSAPKRFQELFQWQAASQGFPKQLKQLESDPPQSKQDDMSETPVEIPDSWKQPALARWARMEPKLGNVDLRDYFWLARDRLGSTLGNLSLVSLHVRRLFNALLGPGHRVAAKEALQLEPLELDKLHELLEQQVLRQPNDKKTYDAFHALIEAGAKTEIVYAALLGKVPVKSIPPAIGPALAALLKSKDYLRPAFKEIIETFKGAKGAQIAAAFQKNL
jgi:predicted KAP-like P-loop ATPase